jgi:hypothetical protein
MARNLLPISTRRIGQLALAGLLLLALLTLSLELIRNSDDSMAVQRAALDLPLLKNRWPQFKKAVEELHTPIAQSLAATGPLAISSPLPEMMQKITTDNNYSMVGSSNVQGRIISHIELIYFEKDSIRPAVWRWSPNVDTGLTATEVHTRASLQQLEQTALITAEGLTTEPITPTTLTNQRRALIFFYLHTEWYSGVAIIKALVRAIQALTLAIILLIAIWAYASTNRASFSVLIILLAALSLVIYSSLMLKALSLRTVLSMLITVQIGPNANRAGDFAGLSMLTGAGYGLVLLGLMHLTARPVCPDCKRDVSDDYRFCPHCNFVLKRNCARCAAPVDTRWNYCPSCSEDI